MTYRHLNSAFGANGEIKTTTITAEFDFEKFRATHGAGAIPLMLLNPDGRLSLITAASPPKPREGQKLIGMISSN